MTRASWLITSGVPSAIVRPKSSATMRSQVCRISGTSCSTTSTPIPRRRATARIAPPSSADSLVSRPAAGSSSSSTAGSVTSARAMPTRRATPCDNDDGRTSSTSPSCELLDDLVHQRGRRRAPGTEQVGEVAPPRLVVGRDEQVLAHRHLLEQLDGLPRPHDAGAGPPLDRPRSMVVSPKRDRSARRRGEAGDDVEDRRLARAVRTDEPDDLAGFDREAHAVDRDDTAELHDEIASPRARRGAGRRSRRRDGRVGDRRREAQPLDDAVQRRRRVPRPARGPRD